MSVPGYYGKILIVDLSSGAMNEVDLPEKVYREYIGGQGLGVRVCYEYIEPNADPLGANNVLGFLAGPITGNGFHGSRFELVGNLPSLAAGAMPMPAVDLATN